MSYINYLVSWLQKEVKKANAKGVIIGLSGGLDSSVVGALAQRAFPKTSLGLYLPIGNMGQDLIDAKEVAQKIGIKTMLIDLTKTFKAIKMATMVNHKLSIANLKPRLRMTALYAIAQENNYLVLGTDNAAEWILGYFTKHGDGGVDLLPLIHLTKKEVRTMAKDLELPKIIYTKAPTAALWDGQTDEEELGYSYDEVDKYLEKIPQNKIIKDKISIQVKLTEHKRKSPPKPMNQREYKFNK